MEQGPINFKNSIAKGTKLCREFHFSLFFKYLLLSSIYFLFYSFPFCFILSFLIYYLLFLVFSFLRILFAFLIWIYFISFLDLKKFFIYVFIYTFIYYIYFFYFSFFPFSFFSSFSFLDQHTHSSWCDNLTVSHPEGWSPVQVGQQ